MKNRIATQAALLAQLVSGLALAQQLATGAGAAERAAATNSGTRDAAQAPLGEATELDPARIQEAHGVLGMEAYQMGDFEAASRHFQAAQHSAGIRWGSWLARSLEKQGLLLEARKHYVQVIAVPLGASAPHELKQAQSEAHRELLVLHARIPKLVLQLRGSGAPGMVSVDDRLINLDRRRAVLQLNPGQHRVTAVMADGSYKSQWIDLMEAEQRHFDFNFTGDSAAAGIVAADPVLQPAEAASSAELRASPGRAPASELGAAADALPQDPSARLIRSFAWGAWGLGTVGFVSALWLTHSASKQERDLVARCALDCSPRLLQEGRDSANDKRLGAAVSLGVGLAGAIAGTVFYFESRTRWEARGASLGVGVSPQGAVAHYEQRF